MAGLALPVVFAVAVEVIDHVHTVAAVLTRVSTALVHIAVAESSLPPVWADALEGVDPVDTGASLLTGVRRTVINILMAVGPGEALVTGAREVSPWLTVTLAVGAAHV